jgi:hypothetical protein
MVYYTIEKKKTVKRKPFSCNSTNTFDLIKYYGAGNLKKKDLIKFLKTQIPESKWGEWRIYRETYESSGYARIYMIKHHYKIVKKKNGLLDLKLSKKTKRK